MYQSLPIQTKKSTFRVKSLENKLEKQLRKFEKNLDHSFKMVEKGLKHSKKHNLDNYTNFSTESQEFLNSLNSFVSKDNTKETNQKLNRMKRCFSRGVSKISSSTLVAALIHIICSILYFQAFKKLSNNKNSCCAKYSCIWPFIFAASAIFFAIGSILMVSIISYFMPNIQTATDGITSTVVSFLEGNLIEIPQIETTLIANKTRIPVKTEKISLQFEQKKIEPFNDFLSALSTSSIQEFLDSEYSFSRDSILKMLKNKSDSSQENLRLITGPFIHAVINRYVNKSYYINKLIKRINEVKATVIECQKNHTEEECQSSDIAFEISHIEEIIKEAVANTNEAANKILINFDDEHFKTFYDKYLKDEFEFFGKSLPMLSYNTTKIFFIAKKIATVSLIRNPAIFVFNTISYNVSYILYNYALALMFALIGYAIIVAIFTNFKVIETESNADETVPPVTYNNQEERAKEEIFAQQSTPVQYEARTPLLDEPEIYVAYPGSD